jgi:hypothetical protein
MTTINKILLKCSNCSKSSIALETASYSTFTIKDIKEVMQPLILRCPNCDQISWRESLEYIGLEESEDRHFWWKSLNLKESYSILKDSSLNGKTLNDGQIAYLREEAKEHILFDELSNE